MRRAAFAMVLLLAAAPAFTAPESLDVRARRLLSEIRAQSAAGKKDDAHLRAELSALETENSASPDEKVSAHLRLAEADLALVDAGKAVPPATADEAVSDQDLPDRDAVAQPTRGAIYQNVPAAAAPEMAGAVFDGLHRRGGLAAGPVGVPPEAPDADLGRYLTLDDDGDEARDFLISASAGLLEKLQEPDADHLRSHWLSARLKWALDSHSQRPNFLSLRVRVPKDKLLHLVYRASSGGAVDEILGPFAVWSNPAPGKHGTGARGRRRGGKKGSGAKKGGGDEDEGGGGSSSGGHKKGGGHKGHGGGGGGGDGGDGGGGGGGGGSHHAKVPHVKGGGGMFDGGESGGGSGEPAGPGAHHGRGARKGRDAASAAAGSGGGAHARAGKYISGDSDGGRAGSRAARSTSVPLPKDFAAHGRGSRLHGKGKGGGDGSRVDEGRDEGGRGDGGSYEGGGSGMSARGHKGLHTKEVPPPPAPSGGGPPAALAQAKPSVKPSSAGTPAAAAAAGPALTAPLAADEDLHDAVAGNATASRPALPAPALASASTTPEAPSAPSDSWPLAAACAAAAGIGLGAYAFRRSRRA